MYIVTIVVDGVEVYVACDSTVVTTKQRNIATRFRDYDAVKSFLRLLDREKRGLINFYRITS